MQPPAGTADLEAMMIARHRLLLEISEIVTRTSREYVHHGRITDLPPLDALLGRVRGANTLGGQLCAMDRGLTEVIEPLLGVPGAAPVVQLRPTSLWRRVFASPSADHLDRNEQLASLRLEVDAAIERSAAWLGRGRSAQSPDQ